MSAFRRVIESEWEVRSAGTVEYRGSAAEEDTPRKPGTEHREGATVGRRKGLKSHERSAACGDLD